MDKVEELVSISDPGEIGRKEHNWGDRLNVWISNIFAWIFPILMLAIVSQVFLRSAGHNQAWLDDLQWWLYGIAVLVGVGYAVTTGSHVRVDIFHANFPDDRKNRIEIFALTWLFLPFVILSWDVTVHYAISSWVAGEGSDSPNGLHRLYLLKIAMNLAFVLMGIAIWAAYVRHLQRMVFPALWRQFLYALPSTFMLVNLAIYYAGYWFIRLTGPADLNLRQITREPFFGTLNYLDVDGDEVAYRLAGVELSIIILLTTLATAALIGLAWLFRQKPGEGH